MSTVGDNEPSLSVVRAEFRGTYLVFGHLKVSYCGFSGLLSAFKNCFVTVAKNAVTTKYETVPATETINVSTEHSGFITAEEAKNPNRTSEVIYRIYHK